MNKKYLALAVFICGLVALNVYILLGGNQAIKCYKNACIMGEKDPVAEIKALLNSSSSAIILAEGDVGNSQKNQYIAGAMVKLSKDFGYKGLTLVTVELQNSAPVSCICERKVNETSFTPCPNDAALCDSMKPNETTVLFKLSYPDFSENRIIVANRTIDFQGMSGQDTLALVTEVFEKLL